MANSLYGTVDFHFGSNTKGLPTSESVSKKRKREPKQNNNKVAKIEHEFPGELIREIFLFLGPTDTEQSLVCKNWKTFYDDTNFHYQIFNLGISEKAPVSDFMPRLLGSFQID